MTEQLSPRVSYVPKSIKNNENRGILNLLKYSVVGNSLICESEVAQSCPTLCDPMDYPVHGILQARVLEWVAYPFSSRSS